MEHSEKLLTKRDVCDIMKISIGKLDILIKEGKIKYLKLEKSVRFRQADIDNYIDSQYNQQGTKAQHTMISDWLQSNRDPKIEIQVLNEVIDKLLNENRILKQQLHNT